MIKKNNFSVLRKLFVIYSFTIIFIYIFLVGIIVKHLNQTTNQLIENRKEQTVRYMDNLEQLLDIIYNHEIGLANAGNTSKISYKLYKDEYEKSRLILDQINNIQNIQAFSTLIENIVITYPSEHITLSSKDGYNKDLESGWDHIRKGTEYNYFVDYNNNIVLNFTYPLMYSESYDYIPDFNIQIFLSNNYILESLKSFTDNKGSGAAIIFKLQDDFIIESNNGSVLIDKKSNYEYVTYESMKYPISIVSFINREVINEIQFNYIFLLTIVMIIITIIYVFSLFYTKHIVIKPLKELMSAFDRIQNGSFDFQIYHEQNDEFKYLYKGFNKAVSYIKELIGNIYEQKTLIENAELAQLQSQINPHFLYNSFFIINRMAKNESYDLITKFVTSLAKYYRYINKENNILIPLYKEVEHMSNYIEIQQMRFGDKISVTLETLPDEIKNINVPKLILQPLIENAYSYGLVNKLDNGLIRISFTLSEDFFTICVDDNGDDADSELVKSMVENINNNYDGGNHALHNINKRLTLALGQNSGISIKTGHLGGIMVSIKIFKNGLNLKK